MRHVWPRWGETEAPWPLFAHISGNMRPHLLLLRPQSVVELKLGADLYAAPFI